MAAAPMSRSWRRVRPRRNRPPHAPGWAAAPQVCAPPPPAARSHCHPSPWSRPPAPSWPGMRSASRPARCGG
eukprot:6777748-Lingulodinium_polyedra.AAC.1